MPHEHIRFSDADSERMRQRLYAAFELSVRKELFHMSAFPLRRSGPKMRPHIEQVREYFVDRRRSAVVALRKIRGEKIGLKYERLDSRPKSLDESGKSDVGGAQGIDEFISGVSVELPLRNDSLPEYLDEVRKASPLPGYRFFSIFEIILVFSENLRIGDHAGLECVRIDIPPLDDASGRENAEQVAKGLGSPESPLGSESEHIGQTSIQFAPSSLVHRGYHSCRGILGVDSRTEGGGCSSGIRRIRKHSGIDAHDRKIPRMIVPGRECGRYGRVERRHTRAK
jgi:hypothetical protein